MCEIHSKWSGSTLFFDVERESLARLKVGAKLDRNRTNSTLADHSFSFRPTVVVFV